MPHSHTEKQRDDKGKTEKKAKNKHWNKTYQLAKLL